MRYVGCSISLLLLAACTPSGPPPAPEPNARNAHHKVASAAAPPPAPVAAPIPSAAAVVAVGGAPAAPCAPATVTSVQGIADDYCKTKGVPGVAIAVYDAGRECIVVSGNLSEGGALVTKDTIFSMGSVQKVFNATLLAYEIEKGNAKIEDPAIKYLSGTNGATIPASAPFAQVTLKELVTHTASLPGSSDDGGDDERDGWDLYRNQPVPAATITFLTSWKPPYPIGTKYAYSNLGFVLAGYAAVGAAKPTLYQDLLGEVITTPLGMQSTRPALCQPPTAGCATGYNARGKPDKSETTGLWTTAQDMLAFLEANLGVRTLPEVQRRAFALTHVSLFEKSGGGSIGMGWEIKGKGDDLTIAKDGAGGGFSSWIGYHPQSKRGVAVLTNGQKLGGVNAPVLGHDVLTALR